MEQEYTAYVNSPAGLVKITADGENITSVRLLKAEYEEQFRNSESLPSHVKQCITELNEYFEGKLKKFTVPVKQKGTGFQQKVWAKLLEIPYGTTISYLELAKRLGDPKLTRAVGGANGKNNLWIIVPCHRVIGADGSLTGYAGGIECKRWLLQLEQNIKI